MLSAMRQHALGEQARVQAQVKTSKFFSGQLRQRVAMPLARYVVRRMRKYFCAKLFFSIPLDTRSLLVLQVLHLFTDSSTELYTDSTGIDLEQFIAETINRNQKDRTVLLKIEKDLIDFARDRQKVSHKFPNMSSYNRMLVHRVAAYFGMEHNVDQSGLSVIVTRTKNMRIPDTRFREHIRDDLILSEEPRRSILKRDSSSFEDSFNFKSPDRMSGDYCRRSKSFEEREEEYERARRRIFKDSSGESSEVASWPWSSSESSDVSARYRLLHPSDHIMR